MAVLLLQGPLGPFYSLFAQSLEDAGFTVHKINFNGGDAHYSNDLECTNFRESIETWPDYLTAFIQDKDISTVFVYGDCREYHRHAKKCCELLSVRYFAFEEGYLRPNYITLEEGGVNGHSRIRRRKVASYKPVHDVKDEQAIGQNMLLRAKYAATYYTASVLSTLSYKHYKHHRSYSALTECFFWLRALSRKWTFKVTQRNLLSKALEKPFFLIPLQVHNDSQLTHHSQYQSNEEFITKMINSFATHGRKQDQLVIKHHPMDRGHSHYGDFINQLKKRHGLHNRLIYLHDQHLPTLLKHCRGVVTINSTTALQGFYHEAPVKTMGTAFYNMKGLTDQCSIETFWQEPVKPNRDFADRFKAYLLTHGQINGSFYNNFDITIENILRYLNVLDVTPLESYEEVLTPDDTAAKPSLELSA